MSRPITVLHVDDESDFSDIVADALEREDDDIRVLTEPNVSDGLARLERGTVDCIVSDFDMPGADGLTFLDTVRDRHGNVPFILFTGKGSEEVASDAIAKGATDYLQKQTGLEQYELLANRVRNAVEQHRAQIERKRKERRFQAVFEDPGMLVALLGPDGRLRKANETAMALIDADVEDVAGTPFWETPWWSEEIRSDVEEWVKRAAEGEYIEYSDDRIHPEGRPAGAQGTIRPVKDESGEVTSLIVSARDTTNRLRYEQRFDAVFNHSRHWLGILDPEGNILDVNDALLSATDTDRDAVLRQLVWEVGLFDADADGRGTLQMAVAEARSCTRVVEAVSTVGGSPVTVSLTPVCDADGTVTLLTLEARRERGR